MNNLEDYIDGAFLGHGKTSKELEYYLEGCVYWKIRGVCVWPYFLYRAKELLNRYQIRLDTQYQPRLILVSDFPYGLELFPEKVVYNYIGNGVQEIDHVLNISALRDGQFMFLLNGIADIVDAMKTVEVPGKPGYGIVKLIVHDDLLTDKELKTVGLIAEQAGVAYIKSSSGKLGNSESTTVRLARIRECIPNLPVKMAGGIKSKAQAEALIYAGASVIGISDFESILDIKYEEGPICGDRSGDVV